MKHSEHKRGKAQCDAREAKHSVKQHSSNRDRARHSEMLQEQDTVSARKSESQTERGR